MTPTDNEFYEAYKKSASFCDDLYQKEREKNYKSGIKYYICLLYTSPSPRD